MKHLHQKIENRKRQIEMKKKHLEDDYQLVKNRLSPARNINLIALGGVALGFLLLPRKFKLLKSIFRAYTIATTWKQLADLIPHKARMAYKNNKNKKTFTS